jgi:hypothetical protein
MRRVSREPIIRRCRVDSACLIQTWRVPEGETIMKDVFLKIVLAMMLIGTFAGCATAPMEGGSPSSQNVEEITPGE